MLFFAFCRFLSFNPATRINTKKPAFLRVSEMVGAAGFEPATKGL